MRITRSKLKQEHKSKSLGLTIVFVFLLPAISIYLGYTAFKLFIIPGIHGGEISQQPSGVVSEPPTVPIEKEAEKTSTEEVSQEAFASTFELQGVNYYSIQVGKFSTIENAESLIKELRSKGYEGYIHKQDGFKVIAITLMDRKGIDQIIQEVRKHYEDAYIVTVNIPTHLIKYTKEDSRTANIIELQNKKLVDVFQKISTDLTILSSSKEDIEKIRILSNESIKELESIKNELEKIASTSELDQVSKELMKVTSTVINGLNESNQEISIHKMYSILNIGLYEYLTFATNSEY